jgi:hypothetical protein
MEIEIMDSKELIPSEIKLNINQTLSEAATIIETAIGFIGEFNHKFYLRFEHSAPCDILSDQERSQQLSFVTRYEHLPEFDGIHLEQENGNFDIANLDRLRLLLNEYRTIIFNKDDSIYYKKLHNFCYRGLSNKDSSKGLSISAHDINETDITDEYVKYLCENTKAIDYILSNCDLDYIYNGILQHSDSRHSKKYLNDYHSGKLNYIFVKNSMLVSETKLLMDVYYKIINNITFPRPGHL